MIHQQNNNCNWGSSFRWFLPTFESFGLSKAYKAEELQKFSSQLYGRTGHKKCKYQIITNNEEDSRQVETIYDVLKKIWIIHFSDFYMASTVLYAYDKTCLPIMEKQEQIIFLSKMVTNKPLNNVLEHTTTSCLQPA